MKDDTSTVPLKRIAPIADNLIDTLQVKANALGELEALFERQLEALRNGNTNELGNVTTQAQECAAVLATQRQKSERQARLLRRVLDEPEDASLRELIDRLEARDPAVGTRLSEAHSQVREHARDVNDLSETLQFALRYAADLNHELLTAMKGAAEDENVRTYTADGQAESRQPSGDRSFVNTIG